MGGEVVSDDSEWVVRFDELEVGQVEVVPHHLDELRDSGGRLFPGSFVQVPVRQLLILGANFLLWSQVLEQVLPGVDRRPDQEDKGRVFRLVVPHLGVHALEEVVGPPEHAWPVAGDFRHGELRVVELHTLLVQPLEDS